MMTGFGPNKLKSIEMNGKKKEADSFSTITHESQHGTDESSCSNSLPVRNPVSFSSRNYRQTSKESFACKKSFNISAKSSNSKGVMSSAAILGESESTTTYVTGFDLNEDIHTSETDDIIQPVFESVSSHNVIHVVAKAGIPNGLPLSTPLKFKGGGLGWKGSSNTSAFRPTFRDKKLVKKHNYSTKKQECFTGFDLNIAAEDEENAYQIGSRSTAYDGRDFASENCPKRSDGFEIDLNSFYDDADEQMIKCSHREIMFDASLKRKEPEGRRDYYNLGYRQVI